MKKKQNYNRLQLSFFDEIIAQKESEPEEDLESNWKDAIEQIENKNQL